MKRRIVLELAEDTTAEDCGGCPAGEPDGPHCDRFNDRRGWGGDDFMRLPACIEAEKHAAGMVEIDPNDLAAVRFDMWMPNESDEEVTASDRVENALKDHAQKAGK